MHFRSIRAHSALYIIVKFVIRYIAKLVQYTLNGEANSSLAILLYVIYIEKLLLKFKKELWGGVKIADHTLKTGGHVDDQFWFVKNYDDDLWSIVESLESCTNALT